MGIVQEPQIIKVHINSLNCPSIQISTLPYNYKQINAASGYFTKASNHHKKTKENSRTWKKIKKSEKNGRPPKWAVWNRHARGWLRAGSNWVLQLLQVLRVFSGLSMQQMEILPAGRDSNDWLVLGWWKWRWGDLGKLIPDMDEVVAKEGIVGELIWVPAAIIIESNEGREETRVSDEWMNRDFGW